MPFRIEHPDRDEVAILLHGPGRPARSLQLMQRALGQAGFAVLNASYPSTRDPVNRLVAAVGRRVAACAGGGCILSPIRWGAFWCAAGLRRIARQGWAGW